MGGGTGFGRAGGSVLLAVSRGIAAHSGNARVFHSALAGQQCELVHAAADVQRTCGRGGWNWRRNRAWAGSVDGGAAAGAGACGVFDFWCDIAALAECVSVVFHMDYSVFVLLSQSGVADADDFAVFVVQRADWIWDFGDVALESADDVAGVRAVLWVAGVGTVASAKNKAARDE